MGIQHLRRSTYESNFNNPDVNAHFRRLDDGTTLFYPLGIFGRRGFVVASAEQEALLRVYAKSARKADFAVILLNYLGLIAIGGLMRLGPWLYAGFVVALLAARWQFLRLNPRHLTKGMAPAAVRNSPVVFWRSEGRMLTPLQLILRLVVVVGTSGISVALALYLKRPDLFMLSGLMAMWCLPLLFMVQGWRRGST